jgi:hypothetical protein
LIHFSCFDPTFSLLGNEDETKVLIDMKKQRKNARPKKSGQGRYNVYYLSPARTFSEKKMGLD